MKKSLFILLFFLFYGSISMYSQIDRVEPPYWWSGMQAEELELMFYGKKIATYEPSIAQGVVLSKITRTENPNYIFVMLDLKGLKAGIFKIDFNKDGKTAFSKNYELRERNKDSNLKEGFNSSDVIYLITPDRFANGSISNDVVKTMNEKTLDRKDDYGRHGGDIKGITNNLEYIDQMGFTAIWPSPVLTNDMKESSYHGYAMTDFYQVDPRFGTLEDYIELAQTAKNKGIKLIMDQVANHIGSEHWWIKDLPANNWINYQDEFLKNNIVVTNHRRTTNQDLYASVKDKNLMREGWFVSSMPDLNQNNPLLAKYLIQNSIWWIETLDLGGIRQDTYPYPDKQFMSNWAGAIMEEYPNFSIVGEEWSTNPLLVGYWQQGSNNKDGYESNLTSTMDFPMQKAIVEALTEEESWDNGFVKMYEGLANDFYYPSPENIMIFPDNHDMDRIFTQLNEDLELTKMALGYMLALPRIPQLYYGTEILMENTAKPGDHGLIRTDFPGGWKNDEVNAFTGTDLANDQEDMQSFLKKMLNYRKNSEAIHSGKTIHFAPENGVYTLFRIKNDETVSVIMNKNEEPISLDLNRFEEVGLLGKQVKNILTDESFIFENNLEITSKGILLLTTKK
ncbi:glycoside hydrolase family 13 protein [Gillisia sp. Q332]|uniref:glycoside hydrolase family 13 protein n=1 Tax=Gillisia xinjiangensis TaxID=3384765 RepID=UPI003918BCCC